MFEAAGDPQALRLAAALLSAYEAISCVELTSGDYVVYAPSGAALTELRRGGGFFAAAAKAAPLLVPEDRERFLRAFTEEALLREIREHGFCTMALRRLVEGRPGWIELRAALAEADGDARLIVAVGDVDAQLRREAAYARELAAARELALRDALTGVKNRAAYAEMEAALDRRLAAGDLEPFALVLFDVNELKAVNDRRGHQAGDAHLKAACRTICELFKHSPVYRLGGDEFAAIAKGRDLERAEALLQELDAINRENARTGAPVVAHGLARRENEATLAALFRRADAALYRDKQRLKTLSVLSS